MAVSARVASVLPDYEVAFNVGASKGVEVGDVATVFGYTPVNDPETGEELGRVRRVRLQLKITSVEDRFSLGQTTEWISPSTDANVFSLFLLPNSVRQRVTNTAERENRTTVFLRPGDEVEITRKKGKAASSPA